MELTSKDTFCPKCALHSFLSSPECKTQNDDDIINHLKKGLEIEERFKDFKKIGEGGFSDIYSVFDSRTKKNIAFKYLKKKKASKNLIIRFFNEARITSFLEHPNIVPIHDFGFDKKGDLFFAMKLIKGECFESILKKLKLNDLETQKKYPLSKLLEIFKQVCDAISYAHSKGIIHRDLKPENIMIGDFGEVYVIDWGLYKVIESYENFVSELYEEGIDITDEEYSNDPFVSYNSDDNKVKGSIHYMSPEQALGDNLSVDELSDIYSLGAILFHILTLDRYIDGQSSKQIIEKIKNYTVTPPHKLNSKRILGLEVPYPNSNFKHCPKNKIPKQLSNIAVKALKKDRAQRYPSVQALTKDIVRYLEAC